MITALIGHDAVSLLANGYAPAAPAVLKFDYIADLIKRQNIPTMMFMRSNQGTAERFKDAVSQILLKAANEGMILPLRCLNNCALLVAQWGPS